MKKSIEILCAVTCIYEHKKLAISCPLGKIIENLESFNAEYLANRFSADIHKVYPLESLGEIELLIAPIVNRFGKIPDKSYATIARILDSESGADMPELKNKIDELYPIEKELKKLGYDSYGVYYVEHNIEKFTDENDIPFSEDKTLLKININNYNLDELINYVRKIYSNNISSQSIPKLFNECFTYSDCNLFKKRDMNLNMKDIEVFFENTEEGSLYIPFAIRNTTNNVKLATGEEIEINLINSNELNFDEVDEYGISIDLIDSSYIFNIVEYVFHKNTNNFSISILEENKFLENKFLALIEKFIC